MWLTSWPRAEKAANNQIYARDLNPLGWFLHPHNSGNHLRIDADNSSIIYVARGERGTYVTGRLALAALVEPLPDCDSFDYEPPREPTALKLLKCYIEELSESQYDYSQTVARLSEIVDVMKREAAK